MIYHPLPSTGTVCAYYSGINVYNLYKKQVNTEAFWHCCGAGAWTLMTLLLLSVALKIECFPLDLFLDPRCATFRQTAENQINSYTQNVSTRWLLANLVSVFLGTKNRWFSSPGHRKSIMCHVASKPSQLQGRSRRATRPRGAIVWGVEIGTNWMGIFRLSGIWKKSFNPNGVFWFLYFAIFWYPNHISSKCFLNPTHAFWQK